MHTNSTQLLQNVQKPRPVEQIVTGRDTTDGAGVKLQRFLTQDLQRRLDPYLMLDLFNSQHPDDYIAGFPDHPHRGFETITYMISGRMQHRDSAGHEGLLDSGGMQWMTAGRGVIHSEIPQQVSGTMEGFQLWLNLPARDKLCAPWYRDFSAADLPQGVTEAGVRFTVIAGASHGLNGAMQRVATMPLYLDLHLPAGTQFIQPLAAEHNAFVLVYRGTSQIAGTAIQTQKMAILANQDPHGEKFDGVIICAKPQEDCRVLLIAGQPLNESIEQYGPFVMNHKQEIYQALKDYREGRLA